MNYFYEISNAEIFGLSSRYMACYDVSGSDAMEAGGYKITQLSERIWKEKDGVVRFVKNRYSDLYDTGGYDVDMEEFMLVKLKAVRFNGSK